MSNSDCLGILEDHLVRLVRVNSQSLHIWPVIVNDGSLFIMVSDGNQ